MWLKKVGISTILLFLFASPILAVDEASDFNLCQQTAGFQASCVACVGTNESPTGNIWTAIGCIPITKEGISIAIVKFIISIAGGGAMIMILLGAFSVTTSTSNPKRLQDGQEMITQAILGLFVIIFSVILLHFIGVDLFQIPGL
jgi:hypothetical protein